MLLLYKRKIYKKYNDKYYINKYGDIFSKFSNKILKHAITIDGHHRVDIHGRHKFVHRLVYLVWIGEIKENLQINHRNDNKSDNSVYNLYQGTQKENIQDCIKNGNRKKNIKPVTIFDKELNKIINFNSVKDFIAYSGHSMKSGSVNKCANKNWFKQKYDLIK